MHLPDNFLFILLVAVAALFRLLASKAGGATRKKPEPPERSTFTPRADQPPPLPPADTEEERIRRFLEALGQSPSSKPPPRVAPRTDIPPRPVAPIQPPREMRPFPLPTHPGEERRRKVTPRPVVAPLPEPKTLTPAISQAPVFEVQESALTAEQTAALATVAPAPEVQAATEQSVSNIATLLRSPSGLRDAIVLREIFGPPRSMQPLHLIGDA